MTRRDVGRGTILLTLLCLIATFGSPLPAAEAGEEESRSARINRGNNTYFRFCSNCHGKEGRGDGSVAKWLKIPPADLTQLSASNDGEFPLERVQRSIDGREPVRGHGSREMPVWGEVFQDPDRGEAPPPDPEARVQAKIDELVEYLKILQQSAD